MLHLLEGPVFVHITEDRRRIKPGTLGESNPWTLCYEACDLPLCYNCSLMVRAALNSSGPRHFFKFCSVIGQSLRLTQKWLKTTQTIFVPCSPRTRFTAPVLLAPRRWPESTFSGNSGPASTTTSRWSWCGPRAFTRTASSRPLATWPSTWPTRCCRTRPIFFRRWNQFLLQLVWR